MKYEDWEAQVHEAIRGDVLWKLKAYRLSLFLSDLTWRDAGNLLKDARLISIADQLCRACGKVSACIAEGFSRGGGRDRARFYEYALGSVREARDWYYKGRHVLRPDVFDHRMQLSSEIIRLVLTMIRRDRKDLRKFDEGE
jgi:four helix bundle protein